MQQQLLAAANASNEDDALGMMMHSMGDMNTVASVSRSRKRRGDQFDTDHSTQHSHRASSMMVDVLQRPVTPEAEIKERERLWYERMQERREKHQRRRRDGDEYQDADCECAPPI